MKQWGRSLLSTYFAVDPRSLGLFRVLFGLVLLADLARRWTELRFWYVNSGLLPNHTLLWRPPTSRLFSLFFTVSSQPEAQLGFTLCAVVYVLFTVGYRTRLAQGLALLARVSLNSRLPVLENGGDMVVDLLCLLTLPLPLGARFSFDALSPRAEAPAPPAEGAEASPPGPPNAPVVSVAVLALILQFAAIYLFNASSKVGAAWRDGSAVFYALHQDKIVTWLGVWMREHLSLSTFRYLTWSTLGTEWFGFGLLITPVFVREARLLAILILPCLHLGFALGLNLGGFSLAMMAFYPLLIHPDHWEWLARRFGARVEPLRAAFERWLQPALPVRPATQGPASPAYRYFGESATLLILFAIATEALNDNAAVPPALRIHQPTWAKAIIEYPRLLQGWRMFAPEPSRVDSMIYVDAITRGGKHVDPYNEVASDQHEPAGAVVPTHMGQSQFFFMYSERIPYDGYAAYRQAFSEWLIAYPERTGQPDDCLMSYDVYFVTDRTPEPGTNAEPTPLEQRRFMTYSAPLDSPCRLAPPKSATDATSVSKG